MFRLEATRGAENWNRTKSRADHPGRRAGRQDNSLEPLEQSRLISELPVPLHLQTIDTRPGSLVPLLPVGGLMPSTMTRRFEVLVGHSLAICVHPCAAWLSRSTSYRAAVLVAYFALGYVLVLGLLQVISA